jgi:hypothetical protein
MPGRNSHSGASKFDRGGSESESESDDESLSSPAPGAPGANHDKNKKKREKRKAAAAAAKAAAAGGGRTFTDVLSTFSSSTQVSLRYYMWSIKQVRNNRV